MGDATVFAQSVPGVPETPLVMGVPVSFLLHDCNSYIEKPSTGDLVAMHMKTQGISDIKPGEVAEKLESIIRATANHTWKEEVNPMHW